MKKRLLSFAKNYTQLLLVIIVIIISLVLSVVGKKTATNILLGTTAIIASIPLAWGMIQTLRSGGFGVDVLALTAIITSVVLG